MPNRLMPADTHQPPTIERRTSSFLVWTIRQVCEIRDEDDDLLLLERRLRPLRSMGVAQAEDRILDKVCLDRSRDADFEPLESVKAFSVNEICDSFGGHDFLIDQCGNCVANICRSEQAYEPNLQLAGCYGYLFDRDEDSDPSLWKIWNDLLSSAPNEFEVTTDPPIHWLWSSTTPPRATLKCFRWLIENSPSKTRSTANLAGFKKAILAGLEQGLTLELLVVPQGMIRRNRWFLPQHCSTCSAEAVDWQGRCPVCGSTKPPNPPRKRHVRGDRPYWLLVRYLGTDGAKQLIKKYQGGL